MKDKFIKTTEREFFKGLAADIGREVAHHIETMYPQAVEACSSNFLLSVKGCVHNEIMAVLDFKGDALAMSKRLAERELFRRKIRKFYGNLRKPSKRLALPQRNDRARAQAAEDER